MPTKILIIKLGYSETLDPEIGKVPSLGDVLRSSPILWAVKEKYPDSHVTWLASKNVEPLLQDIPQIDRLLIWDEFVPFQLLREKYDVLINLEKIAGVCAIADMIDAWVKYGFRFDSLSGAYHGYENGLNFINYIANKKNDAAKGFWQQVLIEMIGVTWKEQPYLIGCKPQTEERYDVGLNYEVGSKWPVKAMPVEVWTRLEGMFADMGLTVSWQEGKKNLHEYVDWINSCRTIMSSDSLGMHIAMALNKKCIALFGPTDPHENYFYENSTYLVSPTSCPLMPCFGAQCATGQNCMHHIKPEAILEKYRELNG